MSSTETATPTPDHDANGRFARGNRGGPGNPFGRRAAEMRQIIVDALTDDAVRKVAEAMIERAQDGNVAAAKLLLQYALGKPPAAADSEWGDDGGHSVFAIPTPPADRAPCTESASPGLPTTTDTPPSAAQPMRTTRAARKAMKRALRDLRRGGAPSPNGSNGESVGTLLGDPGARLDDTTGPSWVG